MTTNRRRNPGKAVLSESICAGLIPALMIACCMVPYWSFWG